MNILLKRRFIFLVLCTWYEQEKCPEAVEIIVCSPFKQSETYLKLQTCFQSCCYVAGNLFEV